MTSPVQFPPSVQIKGIIVKVSILYFDWKKQMTRK